MMLLLGVWFIVFNNILLFVVKSYSKKSSNQSIFHDFIVKHSLLTISYKKEGDNHHQLYYRVTN